MWKAYIGGVQCVRCAVVGLTTFECARLGAPIVKLEVSCPVDVGKCVVGLAFKRGDDNCWGGF